MIAWLNPGAFAGLLLLAGPLLVHLLLRRRAARLSFPTLRFIRASHAAAVRLRHPSDLLLLMLRLAIVGLAVAALAAPVVMLPLRRAAWNAQLARALVIDTSESMNAVRAAAQAAADAETRSTVFAARFDVSDIGNGIRKAAVALRTAPAARREIVVISDFQAGAISESDLVGVPTAIGLRFVRVDAPAGERTVRGSNVWRADGAARQEFVVTSDATGLRADAALPEIDGLALRADLADVAAVAALRRAVAAAGTPAPAPERPAVVTFAGARGSDAIGRPDRRWMLETIIRMERNRELETACAGARAVVRLRVGDARVLCRDRNGEPLAIAGATASALAVELAAPPSAFVSAAAVRALLAANDRASARREEELRRIPDAQLTKWTRAPGEFAIETAPAVGVSDGRWVWAAVLVMLGIEALVRRQRATGAVTGVRHAA